MKRQALLMAALLLIGGCSPGNSDVQPSEPAESAGSSQQAAVSPSEPSQTPGVQGEKTFADAYLEMNDPAFWIARIPNPDEVLLTPQEIAEFNQMIPQTPDTACANLEKYPETLTRDELLARIRAYEIPKEPRYIGSRQLGPEYYAALMQNRNEIAVQEQNAVRWGVVTEEAQLRTWPTYDVSYDLQDDVNFDLNCETVLKTGERVAVLHVSTDEEWLLVQAYNYLGWVAASEIAFTGRDDWLSFGNPQNWLVVTGNRVLLDYSLENPAVSRRELTMGTRLPLIAKKPAEIDGFSTVTSHVVQFPVRGPDGGLILTPVRVPYNLDVSVGFLPYTQRNLVELCFKLLGERYGWSNLWNARDCSGYVLDVYRCFGIDLPRNANNQAAVEGRRIPAAELSDAEKTAEILSMPAGALLEMRGHIVMYLGAYEGEPYVIHQPFNFVPPEGGESVPAGCVLVSSLRIKRGNGESFLKSIRTINALVRP